jgi:predicted metal-binding protein
MKKTFAVIECTIKGQPYSKTIWAINFRTMKDAKQFCKQVYKAILVRTEIKYTKKGAFFNITTRLIFKNGHCSKCQGCNDLIEEIRSNKNLP